MLRLAGLSAFLIALLVVLWVAQPITEPDVRDVIEPAGALAAPLYVLVAGVLGALLVSGPLLAGASGLLFGTVMGFFVTLASAVLSALIARAVGARAARGATVRQAPLAVTVRRHGTFSVVVQRLVPMVPDGPFNYGFGVAGLSARPLVLGTLIGSSPRAFAYTALGDSLDDPFSPLGIVAIAVVVVTGGAGALVAWRLRSSQPRDADDAVVAGPR